ncbi:MAG: glycosyltransferase family 9 protein [Armatimonadota bacterium]
MSNNLSILIVRLSAIGDVVMTTAAVRMLRRRIPDARITWVVESKSAGILEGNPDVDETINFDRSGPASFLKLTQVLRKRQFDVALDFQGLARSALVTAASGAKRRIGYADSREFSGVAYNETVACEKTAPKRRCRHGMACYMRLLEPLGIIPDDQDGDMRVVISDEERESASKILIEAGLNVGEKAAALCPATTRANKHWSEEGWSKLADLLWNEMGMRSIFLGVKKDREMIDRILAKIEAPAINIAGCTTLKQAVAVQDSCSLVVAVDTGLLHTGVAIGKQSIGIFGPTTAWQNHINRDNFAVVRKDMDCVPCFKKPTCERFECITDVTPEEVLSAAQSAIFPHSFEGAES